MGLFFEYILLVFDALLTHPYSTPNKIPRPTPSTTPTITVKYPILGGLAQLVEQRTLKFVI